MDKLHMNIAKLKQTLQNPSDNLLQDPAAMVRFREMCRAYGIYDGELDEPIAISQIDTVIVERPDDGTEGEVAEGEAPVN